MFPSTLPPTVFLYSFIFISFSFSPFVYLVDTNFNFLLLPNQKSNVPIYPRLTTCEYDRILFMDHPRIGQNLRSLFRASAMSRSWK